MLMTRDEAAMAIAIINKDSKVVANAIFVGDNDRLTSVLSEGVEYGELGKMLIEYLSDDKDPKLYEPLLHLVDVSGILAFTYKERTHQYRPLMMELASAVEALRATASRLVAGRHSDYPNLIKFFANDKADELFHRAFRAGLLSENYQPKKGVQLYQLKLVAYAIIQILNLPVRDRWCRFNEQWNLHQGRLSRVFVPMTKGNNIYRIVQLYPEVDYTEILAPRCRQEQPFHLSVTKKLFKFQS